MAKTVFLNGRNLTFDKIKDILENKLTVKIDPQAIPKIEASRSFVDTVAGENKPYYGINTGFGLLSDKKIDAKDLTQLQTNLLRSHACAVGSPLEPLVVKVLILLRANVLIIGHSGVRVVLIEKLLELFNKDMIPFIPEKGSVGASGDLAPLAHLALTLIGEGYLLHKGQKRLTLELMSDFDFEPIKLCAKEGLSLINGTQVMCAIGYHAVQKANYLTKCADLISSASLDALQGTITPFLSEIHKLRPYPGQKKSAARLRRFLKNDAAMKKHETCPKVQDPYSLRCIPQVHGAAIDIVDHVKTILEIEFNSATDNPLVFPETKKILSGGNFHGQPVAFAMDYLCLACAEIGSISERRIEKLTNPTFSNLPPFLIPDSGLNSGFMIPHVVSASLVSENKTLCHPASIDSIPTSADKEDHVSMGTIAASKCLRVINNTEYVLAIEAIAACQGLDFLTHKPGVGPQSLYNTVRQYVPFIKSDHPLHHHFETIKTLISDQTISNLI